MSTKSITQKVAAKKAAASKTTAKKPASKKTVTKKSAAKKSVTGAAQAAAARHQTASAKPAPPPTSARTWAADMDPAAAWMKPLLDQNWSGVTLAPQAMFDAQQRYVSEAAQLWNRWLSAAGLPAMSEPAAAPAPVKDKRFAGKDWSENPAAAYTVQMYLLQARTMMDLADQLGGDAKSKARVQFAVQQWVDAMSPSNFLALNPEAQRLALETQGQSIVKGMQQLWGDVRQGHLSQTDESVFEVGRNVATSEGSVVFENDFFQLIEYHPLTATVHARPILFVPPCINKYYIMDLQPANSLVRYTVEQGHRTFMLSWRNVDESMVDKTWDDYIEHAAIEAIHQVQAITGSDTINTLGFCVGGTILATALAVLAARGEQPAASMTLLTTLIDFADNGVLDLFVDEAMVRWREMTIGEQAPQGPGLLRGQELATTFSFLRPNDLVWNYVVGNYLKGQTPPPFDLLYWNSDSTNLPGPMYCWYLRHTYLQNDLKKPKALTVCGEQLDLRTIQVPIYLYSSREDHIVPWQAAYRSTKVFDAPMRFMLGASGHIAGVINPPRANKRSHWVNDRLAADPNDWFAAAKEKPGSWWTDWSDWLAAHAGRDVMAPRKPGGAGRVAIEPAPGRYVKAKA